MICVAAGFLLSACSRSHTDDPNVAQIQQLRQDAAVTLPTDVAENNDDLLAMAVAAYLSGKQSDADGGDDTGSDDYQRSSDFVSTYMDNLDAAVRSQRAEAAVVAPLNRQAESIVRQMDSLISGEPVNNRPVANAGGNLTATNQMSVQLDGSASSDTNGDALAYRWSLTSSPANSNARFSDPAVVNPELSFDQAGRYEVVLIVNDGIENSDPDSVSIEVILDNSVPVADAGPAQTVPLGGTVFLDGSDSSDIDGDSLAYAWALTSMPAGSNATLSDSTAVKPRFVADFPGSYVAELVVNDGEFDSPASSVVIDTSNSTPVASAGADQSVTVGDRVTLDGSASSDVDGDLLEYQWSITNKPASSNAQLFDALDVAPSFDADESGRYEIALIVYDGMADSDPDTVTISTFNVAPVANAGPDKSTFVSETVMLNGRLSSDADGDPLSFSWSLISIPDTSGADLDDPTAIEPSFIADRPGTYVAQLIVNDGEFGSAPATVTITTENSAPIADAGDDQDVTEGDDVILDGRGSTDADFDDLSYRWSFTSRPGRSNAEFDDPTAAVASFQADEKGKYVVQLIVNDGQVDSQPDTAKIDAARN